jgi:hypothetical protein
MKKLILFLILIPGIVLAARPDCSADAKLKVKEWEQKVSFEILNHFRSEISKLGADKIEMAVETKAYEFWRQTSHTAYLFNGKVHPIKVTLPDGNLKLLYFSSQKGTQDPFADSKESVHIWTDLIGNPTYDHHAHQNGWTCLFELHVDIRGIIHDGQGQNLLKIHHDKRDKVILDFPL